MRQELVSASNFPRYLAAPPAVSREWQGPVIQLAQAKAHQSTATLSDYMISLIVSGRQYYARKMDGRRVEGYCEPGSISINPPGLEATWTLGGPLQAIVLWIPETFVSNALAEHPASGQNSVQVLPQVLVRDPTLEGVLSRLCLEAQSHSPFGQLYVESACVFIANHLVHRYS